ncbi:hypothetical protein BU26DRAFT_317700 [Trematosphaeria pertusa]|uniref:Zn(2)-C6 fungal-type domain-containing protein n=1 Tax=Trematosphaeria pertusa TaxID=390896 RepID=A0A6A6IIH9_9PLEO|nr:uncharacterized protein BU26DRAFT_317700 [Trematosphaeria pertusa]KAF2249380.1 hypothetical protein BU26DRAFT_317700 [Trematosphaeria pertusa]
MISRAACILRCGSCGPPNTRQCDETKPACKNCSRNHLQCGLAFLTPIKPEDRLLEPRAISISFQCQPGTSPLSLGVDIASPPLDLESMELLHHYTSVAFLTIGPCRNMHIWQIEIPRLALSHDFLMRGLLALSAVHLATLQPHRSLQLRRRAATAELTALPSFREHTSTTKSENIHAVFAFAGFLPPYLLAQSGWLDAPRGRIPSLDDDRPHWFLFIRGLTGLLARSLPEIAKGPFGPTLTRTVAPVDCSRNPEDSHLAEVYPLLQPTASSTPTDKEALSVCRGAIDELRRVAALPYSPCRTLEARAMAYIWPGSVSHDFVNLLHSRRPEALVILAHYCVLLKQLNWCWYLRGVGDAMLGAIDHELGDRWRHWITWALDYPTTGNMSGYTAIASAADYEPEH